MLSLTERQEGEQKGRRERRGEEKIGKETVKAEERGRESLVGKEEEEDAKQGRCGSDKNRNYYTNVKAKRIFSFSYSRQGEKQRKKE